MSPTGLAKKAGISATTLTRPINNPEHKFAISTSTISKISAVTGFSPAPFFATSNIARQQKLIIKDAQTRHPPSQMRELYNGRREFLIPVGVINAGEWRDNDLLNPALFPPVLVTHSWYAHDDIFAIAVVDERANKLAMPGEFLICSNFSVGKEFFSVSQVVILQQLADGGRKIQLTACYAQKRDNGWDLYPTTDLPGVGHPMFMNDLEGENDGMQIIGLVHYVVRQPRLLGDA